MERSHQMKPGLRPPQHPAARIDGLRSSETVPPKLLAARLREPIKSLPHSGFHRSSLDGFRGADCCVVVASWCHGKRGRKRRLEATDTEVDVPSKSRRRPPCHNWLTLWRSACSLFSVAIRSLLRSRHARTLAKPTVAFAVPACQPGSPDRLDSLDRGLRIAAKRLRQHTTRAERIFNSFPITFMGSSHDEAKRPASNKQDNTSQATPSFKLKDGPLSATVFARSKGKDEVHLFIVPERAYRNKDQEWVSTHILHQDDLLPMSLLLMKVYARMRHQTDEPRGSADSKSQG